MKKRLRKKKHCGEFTQWGRQLVITRNTKDGFDDFLDAFILGAVEANGCFCGGVGCGDNLDVIVELGRSLNDVSSRMQKITSWLDSRLDIQGYRLGDVFDLWNGDYKDLDEEIV